MNVLHTFLILVALGYVQGQCESSNFEIIEFQSVTVEYFPVGLAANVNYRENASVDVLYALQWQNGQTKSTPTIKSNVQNLMDWDIDTENKTIKFSLIEDITGIVDYASDDRTDRFSLTISFDFINSQCDYSIPNYIDDVNTQKPETDLISYDVIIREDYPIGIPLESLQVEVFDLDATTPNTQFEVTLDDECPLSLTEDQFSCKEGTPLLLEFSLKTSLNYEEIKNIECTLTLEDKGNPSLSSEHLIMIEVSPYPDEIPEFNDLSYEGQVFAVEKGSPVEIIPSIQAVDMDDPATEVTYSMKSTDTQFLFRDYFKIDEIYGNVTVNKFLDNEYLSNKFVSYVITATDADGQESTAFLLIELPPTPSTTATEESTQPGSSYSSISSIITTTKTDTTKKTTRQTDPTLGTTTTPDTKTDTSVTPMNTDSSSELESSTTDLTPPADAKFDQDRYFFQILYGTSDVGTIHAESSEEIQYFWDPACSSTSAHFDLDKKTGKITSSTTDIPTVGEYELVAECTKVAHNTLLDVTDVVILVSEAIASSLPVFEDSIYEAFIEENGKANEEIVVVNADGASVYCLEATIPEGLEDYISVENTTGKVTTTKPLDADLYTEALKVKIIALAGNAECPQLGRPFTFNLERNEALVLIWVEDENDNEPFFADSYGESITELTVAFPENIMLQSTVGMVTHLQAEDLDANSSLTFFLEDSTNFIIDGRSGEIFCIGECMESCGAEGCPAKAQVTDGMTNSTLELTILPLPLESIYSLVGVGMTAEDVDSELEKISADTGTTIQKLYTEITDSGNSRKSSPEWKLDIHIYVLNGSTLIDIDDFNVLLEEAGYDSASEFTRKSLYEDDPGGSPEDDSNTGLIIGLCVLGVSLIVVVVACFYIDRKRKKENAQFQKRISTLASVYPTIVKPNISTNSSISERKPSISSNSTTKTSFSLYSDHKASVTNYAVPVLREFSAINSNVDTKGIDNPAHEDEKEEILENIQLPRPVFDEAVSSATDSKMDDAPVVSQPAEVEDEHEAKSVTFKVLVDARIIHKDPLEHDSDSSVYL